MLAISARHAALPAPPQISPATLRKLEQTLFICASPDIAPGVARLAVAIVMAADEDGLLMLGSRELAAMAACEPRLAARHLRELATLGFIEADSTNGYPIAIRVTLRGNLLREELETHAWRLREARRDRA